MYVKTFFKEELIVGMKIRKSERGIKAKTFFREHLNFGIKSKKSVPQNTWHFCGRKSTIIIQVRREFRNNPISAAARATF